MPQAQADQQLEEQQEKQARALKAMQRAQKLLATHVSMAAQQAAGGGGSAQQQRSGTSSGSSTSRSTGSAAVAAAAEVSCGGGAPVVDARELEQDVQVSQLRLVMRTMLQELRVLDQQHPGEVGWWGPLAL
jgi:hypothetical protein